MRISVFIKPRARCRKVEKTPDGYCVHVTEPPVENKANEALIKALSEYFEVSKSRVRIVGGLKSKHKVVEVG